LANFLSISPNQAWFLPYVCLVSELDFSAIPVLISAVSFTGRQAWQNVNSREDCENSKCTGREKTSEILTSSCFCLYSFYFWGEVSNS
jgi:hypothetical protein